MKTTLAGLLVAAAAVLALAAEPEPVVAVKAARLLDVKTGRYLERPVVVIRGHNIDIVGSAAPPEARVIDL
ncbi:MAG TPA: amidohydrolase family protein, partial [Thermoanaerobaculia bacterium]|nr:amidohydrolase family protein [Thermoanaerobaculia bacterium]